MKSAVTSTLFFSAQALTCFCITSLAPGTQWSQKPNIQFARGAGGADMHQWQRRRGRRQFDGSAA